MMKENKNIDQLFEHFEDQEVPYNPESWDKMEALLDKEMPVEGKKSAIRRLLPHIVGIGLITSLGLGYFITPFSNDTNTFGSKGEEMSIQEAQNPNSNDVEQWVMSDIEDKDSNEIRKNMELYHEHFDDDKALVLTGTNQRSTPSVHSNATNHNTNPKKVAVHTSSSTQLVNEQQKVVIQEQETIAQQIDALKKNPFNVASIEKMVQEDVIQIIQGEIPTKVATPITMNEIKVNDKVYAQNVNSGFIYEQTKDTITKVNVIEKLTNQDEINQVAIFDTVSIVKIERKHYTPLPLTTQIELLEQIKNSKEQNLAALNVGASFGTYHAHSQLQKITVKHKNAANTQWLSQYFNENKPQFAYLYFGGNGFLGKHFISGAHAGFGIGYVISEFWNLNVDLKYTNQFLGQLTFEDHQAEYDVDKKFTGKDWEYRGTGSEMTQEYTINQIQNFQLSSYFSYNMDHNFSIMMGIMTQARLPIKFQQNLEVNTLDISQVSSSGQLFEDKDWSVDPTQDFKSSFSLGYMVGVQYDINKKWGVQAKMHQSLLHSLKSDLDYLRKMSSAPTVELSLGYFFGRKDKIVYIMDYTK